MRRPSIGPLSRLLERVRRRIGAGDSDTDRARRALPALLALVLRGAPPADPLGLAWCWSIVQAGASRLPDDPRQTEQHHLEAAFARGAALEEELDWSGFGLEAVTPDELPASWHGLRDAIEELARDHLPASAPAPEPDSWVGF